MTHYETVIIDLDAIDLEREQGFGSGVPVVRVDIFKGGKRITAHLSLFQHEMKRDPTLNLTVVGKSRDVSRRVQVRPWCADE